MAVSDLWFDKAEGSVLLSCRYQYELQQVWTSLYRMLALSARESYEEVESPSLPFPIPTFSRVVTSLCLVGQSFVWPSPLIQPWIWSDILSSLFVVYLWSVCHPILQYLSSNDKRTRLNLLFKHCSMEWWHELITRIFPFTRPEVSEDVHMNLWLFPPVLFSSHENMWE